MIKHGKGMRRWRKTHAASEELEAPAAARFSKACIKVCDSPMDIRKKPTKSEI
jgi:hypothetical protein